MRMNFNSTLPEISSERASESLRFGSKTSISVTLLSAANPMEVSAARGRELHEDMLVSAMHPPPSGASAKAMVTAWTC